MKNKKAIEDVYNHPKWYHLMPLIGFFKFMSDITNLTKDTPFMQKSTPEYKIMQDFTKKFFLYLNIFVIVYFLFCIFIFNIGLFVWKKPVRRAGLDIK